MFWDDGEVAREMGRCLAAAEWGSLGRKKDI